MSKNRPFNKRVGFRKEARNMLAFAAAAVAPTTAFAQTTPPPLDPPTIGTVDNGLEDAFRRATPTGPITQPTGELEVPRLQPSAPAWAADRRFAELVMDAVTGEIVYERNGFAARHLASMTKVMTAYLVFEALERGDITRDQMLTASAAVARQTGMRYGLRAGQQISLDEALHCLIAMSGNDCAVLLAETLAGTERDFANRMTETAHRIGATNSTFGSASGLFGDLSSARDIALIFRAVNDRFPALYDEYFTPLTTPLRRETWNNCRLCDDGIDATGQKTGTTTPSGHSLIVQIEREGRRYIVVTMGTPSSAARMTRAVQLASATWSWDTNASSIMYANRRLMSAQQQRPTTASAPPPQVVASRTATPAGPIPN